MRALVAEAMAAGAAGRVVVGRADAPRPRRPAGAVARRRPRRARWRWPRRPGRAGAGSIAYLPASAIGGLDADRRGVPDPLSAVSGLPVDDPGPRRAQQGRRADRHVGGRAGVPRPRHRSRRARVLDAHRAAVRPPGRDRRDQLPLPRGARVGPHAEAAARRAGRAACATRGARRAARRGRALQPRSGARARRCRRRCGTRCSSTRSRSPSTRSTRSRSIAEIADERGVAPADAMLDLALAEDLATRFRWRTESPEWAAAVGEAQLDAADDRSASPTAARTSRATTAPTGARTSCARGCSTARCGRSRRASARSRRCRRRCVGFADRGVIAPGRAGRPHGVRSRDDRPVEEGVRARPARRRRPVQGVGQGRARRRS